MVKRASIPPDAKVTVGLGSTHSPQRVYAAMILVYGDDSADEKRERVCSVAIVAGLEEHWAELEPLWAARNGTIPFHAKDCESDQGDYRVFCHQQNKERYKDLAVMLASSKLIGRAVTIDLIAAREVFSQAPDINYYKAFAELLEAVKDRCLYFRQPAIFKFDISTSDEFNAGRIYQQFRDNYPEIVDLFDSEIVFGRAKECSRLQVADMLAFEGMKALDNIIGPVKRPERRSWKTLAAHNKFQISCYSREYFEDLRKTMPELEKQMGYNVNDYWPWLKERNRQHSISSLVDFTEWQSQQDEQK